MRDHPEHGRGMIGGAWDTDLTRTTSRSDWKQAWTRMLEDPVINATRDKYGSDQNLLNRYPVQNFEIFFIGNK